jgi:hypothetical protein
MAKHEVCIDEKLWNIGGYHVTTFKSDKFDPADAKESVLAAVQYCSKVNPITNGLNGKVRGPVNKVFQDHLHGAIVDTIREKRPDFNEQEVRVGMFHLDVAEDESSKSGKSAVVSARVYARRSVLLDALSYFEKFKVSVPSVAVSPGVPAASGSFASDAFSPISVSTTKYAKKFSRNQVSSFINGTRYSEVYFNDKEGDVFSTISWRSSKTHDELTAKASQQIVPIRRAGMRATILKARKKKVAFESSLEFGEGLEPNEKLVLMEK